MIPLFLQQCRLCGNPYLDEVLGLGKQTQQGQFNGKTQKTPQRNLNVKVVRCNPKKFEGGCSLLQLNLTVPPSILYTQYFYLSHISETMREHLKTIAIEMSELLPETSKILDIACNSGFMLECFANSFQRFGVDPNNVAGNISNKELNICNDFFPSDSFNKFTEKHLIGNFRAISCISMMYDLHDPVSFIKEMDNYLDDEGFFVGEVAYVPTLLKNLAYDNFCFEHLTYYSLTTLEDLLSLVNLQIFRVKLSNINGGVIQFWACKKGNNKYNRADWLKEVQNLRIEEFDLCLDEEDIYVKFANDVQNHARELNALLTKLKLDGKTTFLLGASTKIGVVLNYAGITNYHIPYAVERTPEKFGMSTIGTNIKIISESQAKDLKPDYYLLGPYFLLSQVIKREKEFLDNGGKIIVPLPKIKIWDKNGLCV
ncbi:MAG: methyltransferase domain-containing protein [Nanoarchaeota archaeon]